MKKEGGNYKAYTEKVLSESYNYDYGKVFFKPKFRLAVLAGCQVTGHERAEFLSPGQVAIDIDLFGFAFERVATFGVRRIAMAVVASSLGVDDIAAQSDQPAVFALQIKRHGRNLKTLGDFF